MKREATRWSPLVVAAIILFSTAAFSQRNLTLYSMAGLQQATHANPSFIPDAQVVVGLPLISDFNVSLNNDGFTLSDIGAKGWDPRNAKINYGRLLSLVDDDNVAFGGLHANLLAVGIRVKNNYFAFEAAEHVHGSFYYSKSAIQFAFDINDENYEPGRSYSLNGLAYDLTHYRSLSLSYARQVGRASTGARLRYLVGLENFLISGPGIALTSSADVDVYDIQGQAQLWAAGVQSLSGGKYPKWGAGNYGFAFDLGSTYAITNNFTASFSILNLGGIKWNSGVNRKSIFDEIQDPDNEIEKIFDNFIDGKPAANLSYSSALPLYVNLGGAYQFSNSRTLHFLLNSRYFQDRTNLALAFSYSQKLSPGLQASLSYSIANGSLLNLGGGLVAKAGPLQFFLVTDNLFSVINPSASHNAHLNIGLNLAFHKKQNPVAEAIPADTMAVAPDLVELEAPAPPKDTVATAPPAKAKPQVPAVAITPAPSPKDTVAAPAKAKPESPALAKTPEQAATPPVKEPAPAKIPAPVPTKPAPAEPETAKKPAATPEEVTIAGTPPAERPGAPAASGPAPGDNKPRYTTIQGAIRIEGEAEKVDHFYSDVYKLHPDGRQELMRTGRFPGGDYRLFLERGHSYRVIFKHPDGEDLVARVDGKALEKAGESISRDITLRKASPVAISTTPADPKPAAPPAAEPARPAETEKKEAAPKKEPVKEAPKKEPAKEPVKEPVKETPKKEPVKAAPKKEPAKETPKETKEEKAAEQPVRAEEAPEETREVRLIRDVTIYRDKSLDSAMLARLSEGIKIKVLDRSNPEWWKISYAGNIGWIEVSQLK